MELVFLRVCAWGLRSGGLSVKPRGLEHPLGCAHWRRPSGCKRQLSRSGSLEWMRRFADISCLCLRVCECCLQVRDWVIAVLKAKNLDEGKAAAAAQRLQDEEVTGAMLFGFTAGKLLEYGVKRGPADTLVNELQASGGGAPSVAMSGFQAGASADWKGALASLGEVREDDLSATEFIQELANATPMDLGEGRSGAWGG